jgi:lysophospholipase L1-like esterase/poly(3-hydroxybutyrate) depolymerase
MKLFAPLLLALCLLVPTLHAAESYEPRTFQGPDGKTLNYQLLTPRNRGQKVPLVLFMHGAGERGTDNKAQLKHGAPAFLKADAREKFPCYVIAPQVPPEEKWTDIDWRSDRPKLPPQPSATMQLTLGAIETLMKEFPDIDPDRLYVTGLSMGGYGTWDLITRFPDRFAAAAPICGGGDVDVAPRAKHVPIWAFHGDQDKAVKVERSREMIAALTKAGGQPLYTEYPTVPHDSWTPAYSEPHLLPWMFAQRRGQAVVPFEKVAGRFAQPPTNLFPGEGPVQGGLWFRPLWESRRTEWSKAKAQDQGAVVFLGDSITQGWQTLAQDFPGLKVANRGLSGDTTRGVRFRLKEDVIDVNPRAVVLLIGTNDIGLGATPELTAANVQTIVRELRAAHLKLPVLVCKVMPSDETKQRPAEKLRRLNALVDEAVAGDPLAVRVETWSIFADETGDAKKEEFPDLLHPNAAGYAKWKAALEPVFAKLGLTAPAR